MTRSDKNRTNRTIAAGLVVGAAVAAGSVVLSARRSGSSVSLFLARTAQGIQPKIFDDAEKTRHAFTDRAPPQEAEPSASIRRLCDIDEAVMEGQRVLTLTPREGRSDLHIIYVHGGAFVYPLFPVHWDIIQKLVEETGASVTVPLYKLVPEHDHRQGFALIDLVYEQVARDASARIVLAGDSAGANLAMTTVIRRRDADLSLPIAAVLFSPWLDLTIQDPAAREIEADDVILGVDGLRLCGRWWAGTDDPASPHFSPLFADAKGLPPVAIFQGDRDIFVADARAFAAKAKAAGVQCDYHETRGGFHGFVGATFTPEARKAFRRVGEFVARQHLR